MDEMKPEMMKCPGCGMELELKPASPESEMSMNDAQTMPLDELRNKLPHKDEE